MGVGCWGDRVLGDECWVMRDRVMRDRVLGDECWVMRDRVLGVDGV